MNTNTDNEATTGVFLPSLALRRPPAPPEAVPSDNVLWDVAGVARYLEVSRSRCTTGPKRRVPHPAIRSPTLDRKHREEQIHITSYREIEAIGTRRQIFAGARASLGPGGHGSRKSRRMTLATDESPC